MSQSKIFIFNVLWFLIFSSFVKLEDQFKPYKIFDYKIENFNSKFIYKKYKKVQEIDPYTRSYIDTTLMFFIKYTFNEKGRIIYIESFSHFGKYHGIVMSLIDSSNVSFYLYDNGESIGEVLINTRNVKAPTSLEYFRNGNIIINRFYNYKKKRITERISYNECFISKMYSTKNNELRVIKLNNSSFNPKECNDILADYYCIKNYHSLIWIEHFTGISVEDIFRNLLNSTSN